MRGLAQRRRVDIYGPDNREEPAVSYARSLPIPALHGVIVLPTADGGQQRAVVAGVTYAYEASGVVVSVYTHRLIGDVAGPDAVRRPVDEEGPPAGGAAHRETEGSDDGRA